MTLPDRKINGAWVKREWTDSGVRHHTKSYRLWCDIKLRCIDGGKYQQGKPTYAGCTMSEDFKNYQYFAEWCQSQVGYGLPDYQIDKDLLVTGNKIYGENTCVFIPSLLNMFITSTSRRRDYPTGVYKVSSKKVAVQRKD